MFLTVKAKGGGGNNPENDRSKFFFQFAYSTLYLAISDECESCGETGVRSVLRLGVTCVKNCGISIHHEDCIKER